MCLYLRKSNYLKTQLKELLSTKLDLIFFIILHINTFNYGK